MAAWRNTNHGYGAVTKTLHWLTVAALVTQFTIGYTMSADDKALDLADDRLDELEERLEEQAEGQGEAAEERVEAEIERLEDELDAREDNYVSDAFSGLVSGDGFGDGLQAPEVHVMLGLFVLTLGIVRLVWRRASTLPPWAAHLSAAERMLEAWLEKLMLVLLFLVPGTGLLLVVGDEEWLPVHIAAQITLITVVALHVGLVIKNTVVNRRGQLFRMM